MGDMVLCVGGEETNSFFMGGRECEDGEGKRGGKCEVGFGDGYCFSDRKEWMPFSFQSAVFIPLLSHFFLHVG